MSAQIIEIAILIVLAVVGGLCLKALMTICDIMLDLHERLSSTDDSGGHPLVSQLMNDLKSYKQFNNEGERRRL